jgi:glycosyltransferase involved in cell wall biosynthesis
MHILMAHKNWHFVGGVEKHMFEVRDWLERRGHEVIPFSMHSTQNEPTPYDRYFVSPVDMRATSLGDKRRASARALFGAETRGQMRRLLANEKIHGAYIGAVYHQMGSTFLADMRAMGVPTVLTLHDYKLGCPNYRFFDEKLKAPCYRCLKHKKAYLYEPIKTACAAGSRTAGALLAAEAAVAHAARTYERVDIVTVVNELQARVAGFYGIDSEKIRLVPHAVDLSDDPGSRHQGAADRGSLLYVGRLSPEKGVDIFLRAAHHAGWPVTIVGDGRERQALETLAAELNMNARFVGQVPPAEVTDFLTSAAALVVPSTWPEVWGLVVNEAISAQVPVIASDTGALTDLLAEERGSLFPVGDIGALASHLTRLRENPDAFGRQAARAREYARVELSRSQWESRMAAAFGAAGLVV